MASAENSAPSVHRCLSASPGDRQGWRLVSFDRDFERFEGLELLALR